MKLMLGSHGFEVLSDGDIERIINSAFEILHKCGVCVENRTILERLEETGGTVDYLSQRVYFPINYTRDHISGTDKAVWNDTPVKFSAIAEIYNGYYLDPVDGGYKEWDEKRLFDYLKVAGALKNIDGVYMLGCPVKEIPSRLQPLYEKLYCWKYGIYGGQSIWDTNLCGGIYDMYQIYASETGGDIKDLFKGTVYMISPLRLGRIEAEQFMFFYEKGLRVNIGYNGSLGGAYPVTLAGALASQLAEAIFVSIADKAFFGIKSLHIGTSLSVTEMSNGCLQYGRPEKSIANLAMAGIAKHLGVGFSGHCGLSDAKAPGFEAGVQKLTSVLFNAAACGEANFAAGLLGTDEICSPVQLIMEDQLIGSLNRICEGMDTSPESIALGEIIEAGPGAMFLDKEHTAANYRRSLWNPGIWSRSMFNSWDQSGRENDTDKAKKSLLKSLKPQGHLKAFFRRIRKKD